VLVGLLCTAQAQPPDQRAEQAYEKASQAFQRGEFAEAMKWLEAAMAIQPRPIYVYNIGRVEEAMGRLAAAHATFLRVQAMADVPAPLAKLAAQKAKRLTPLTERAVLVVSGLPAGARVQLDAALLRNPGQELAVDVGVHQLCVISRDERTVACQRADLPAGERTDWRPPTDDGRGALRWTPEPDAVGLELNGAVLLVDPQRLQRVSVDAGQHVVRVVRRSRTAPVQLTVFVGKETRIEVAPEPAVVISERPSVWPWIVSGVGLATVGVGVGLFVAAGSERGVEDVDGLVVETTQVAHRESWSRSADLDLAGAVLLGVGTTAIVAGLVGVLVDRPSASASIRSAVWLGVSPLGLTAGGRF